MVQQGGLIHGAGVVVQAPGDGQVHGEILRRDAEVRQIPDHRVQLLKTLVEDFVPAPVALQSGENGVVSAGDGDKLQDLVGVGRSHGEVAGEDGLHLLRPDLVQLVHGAHDVAGLFRQTHHGVEAVENFPNAYSLLLVRELLIATFLFTVYAAFDMMYASLFSEMNADCGEGFLLS